MYKSSLGCALGALASVLLFSTETNASLVYAFSQADYTDGSNFSNGTVSGILEATDNGDDVITLDELTTFTATFSVDGFNETFTLQDLDQNRSYLEIYYFDPPQPLLANWFTVLSKTDSGLEFGPNNGWYYDFSALGLGSAFSSETIFVTAVPVPAAIWLFGSGMLGLVGIARRKKAT